MTTKQLIKAFQSELHQRDRGPVADTDDILHFLTKAQENFVKDAFAGKRTSRDGFEQSQDLIDDLRVFYKKDCVTETVYAGCPARWKGIHVDYSTLPDEYVHLVSARARIKYSTRTTPTGREPLDWTVVDVTVGDTTLQKRIVAGGEQAKRTVTTLRLSQSDDVFRKLDDPFHTTIHSSPLCDLNNDRVNVYTSSEFITEAIVLNYIRAPKEITLGETPQTSELPEVLHRELVDRAVRLFAQRFPRSSQPEDESS